MSATPIPRTLAMLFYADMDISRITDKPKNRLPIKNYVANINEREKAFRSIKKQIDLGHQAYVICPAIDRSDDEDVGDITNQRGIYEYVLDGDERHLSIRKFSDKMARTAYERQKGICPVCGKHFAIEEMQADHITPWSKGGRTVAENCQMLCRRDNALKSDR